MPKILAFLCKAFERIYPFRKLNWSRLMKRLKTSLKGIISFLPNQQGGLFIPVAISNGPRHVLGNRFHSPVFHY